MPKLEAAGLAASSTVTYNHMKTNILLLWLPLQQDGILTQEEEEEEEEEEEGKCSVFPL